MGQVGLLVIFTSTEVYSGSFCRLGASDSMGRQGVSVSICVGTSWVPGLARMGCGCWQGLVVGYIPVIVWAVSQWAGSQCSGSQWCQLLVQGWVPVLLVSDQVAGQWGFLGLCMLGCTFSGTFCS